MSFNHSGTYTCECGRTFSSSQAYNGHKSHCTIHLSYTNRLDVRKHIDATNGEKSGKKLHSDYISRKEAELATWLANNPTCERCGKIMTEYYGSGRFCSRFCANSKKHSDKTKQKISYAIQNSLHNFNNNGSYMLKMKRIAEYNEIPNICKVCGSSLPYDKRYNKTCSVECKIKLLHDISSVSVEKHGGNMNTAGFKSHRAGSYKGIHCDSSWELAFLVYHLDNNLDIMRNTKSFNYVYENKLRKYFPDFFVSGKYIEIKNYNNPNVQAKIDQFPNDETLLVLYWKDVKFYYDYCVNKYGKEFWTVLYE